MKSQQLVDLHNVQRLPMIVHTSSATTFIKKKNGSLLFRPKDQFSIRRIDHTVDELISWANTQTGNKENVPVYYTTYERSQWIAVVIFSVIGLIFLAVLIVIKCRKHSWLVAMLALLVQYVSTSGIFYNILQGWLFSGVDNSGKPQFIMPGTRGQYLSEGLFMAGLTIISGLCLLGAARLPYTGLGRKLEKSIGVIQTILIFTSISCYFGVFQGYKIKSGWYQVPDMLPPSNFKTGPAWVDQGNSF